MLQPRRLCKYRPLRRPNSTGPLAGGMSTLHTRGRISFRGGKYYAPETGRLQVAQSTNVSTRFAEYKHSVPFNQYAVYSSWEEDHTRDDGGGMEPFPTFRTCGESV